MVAAAVLAHAVAIALVSELHTRHGPDRRLSADATIPSAPVTALALARVSLIDSALVDELPAAIPGDVLTAVLGAGDRASAAHTHPRPRASVDLAGPTASESGGGSAGGPETETGRRDDDQLHQQTWNDPDRYRLARHRTSNRVRSPESIRRVPRPGWDERTRHRKLARTGKERGSDGAERGEAHGVVRPTSFETRWRDADPFADAPARVRIPEHDAGSSRTDRVRLHADRGATSTEARRRGAVADDRDSAAASNETHPGTLELTRPRSGGTSTGVAGPHRGRGIAQQRGIAGGTAATRVAAEIGPEGLTVYAWRQNPYFRRMYRRVDERVRFPRRLALALEQGELVAQFRLYSDGRIGPVQLSRSSGYRQFDRAVMAAIRRAAPFGPVPKPLLKGRASITVQAPYTFSNPLIR